MSKKPTGLTISRSGGWFSASWKCGDKNYSGGQQFQYNINSRGWASLSIGTGTRAKGFDVGINGYYPNTGALLYTVSVRVRGKVRGGSWSAWTYATYTTYAPNAPSLDVSVDEQHTNVCTFSWNLVTDHADAQPFLNVLWESILVKESDVTDGSQLVWGASATGWDWGLGYDTGTITKTEDTTLLADASYTRWFRVCARGARGGSAWTYAKHVYARPFQAKIEYADMSVAGAEGMSCYARWTADQTPSHPIDHTTVQYLITVPNADLACPSGAQWSDANISADTSASDAVRFSIDNVLDKDECLFIRVNTIYGQNTTYSSPKLAAVGNLKDPTDLSYQVDNTNHTLTSVSVDNNSDVPDSFIAIVYRAGSNPEDELVVGIIPHGASQPLVTPVQCPDWSGESAFSIGAYAAVGTYEANSIGYTVNAKMRSASTIWVGGAVPVAPENVNVVQSPITGTATVTWDWTWEEANFAQLSWTDHDDAWESTDEPEIYNITKPKATKWNISGLELGKKWYIAVRLVSGNPEEENVIYSPWSDMRDIILSSVPNVPSLNLSAKVITEGEEITASWDFVSNDGTGQISAEIKDEDDNLIAHTETQKEVVIDTEALGWSQGETHGLSVRVTSGSNRTTEWSNPVSIVVAEALSGSIADTSLETVEINPRSFEKTDFLSFLTEQEEVFTKLQVDLDPIQDLNGYDAPWVGGARANIWDEEWEVGGYNSTTGEPTGGTRIRSKNYIPVLPNTEYSIFIGYITGGATESHVEIFYDENKNFISGRWSSLATFTVPSNAKYVRFNTNDNYGTTYNNNIAVNYPSTVTTYAPYENICPISGRNSVTVLDNANAQIWDEEWELGSINDTTGANVSDTTHIRSKNYIPIVPNTSYYFYVSVNTNIYYYDANKNYLSKDTVVVANAKIKTMPSNAHYLRFYCGGAYGTTYNNDISINYPSTDTDYHAYNGTTYTTQLGQTVYGGTLDVVSGVLTVDDPKKWLNKANNWQTWGVNANANGITGFYIYANTIDPSYANFREITYCEMLPIKSTAWGGQAVGIFFNMGTSTPSGWYYLASFPNSTLGILDSDDNATAISKLNTFLENNPIGITQKLATPQTYQLTPQQIQTLVGQNNMWSEDGEIEITIAEKSVLSLTQMPLTVELSGVDDNVISTLTIERTADYHMDRPDETQFDGFEGEIVYLKTQNGGEDIVINREDLIGLLDDGAFYRVYVTFKDVYGQSMSDSVDFEVHWDHQAIVPEASVEIDEENLVAKLTPIAPTGTLTGDTCDIYRLSADRPELIVKDAVFGTQYVDPYPAIGEFGGHRFVFKTVNGDYITATNDIAWTDTGLEEGDILESERAIIDFDGNQLLLYYNVDVGHQWDKDFQETKYLGGSVQGDWNAGVSRSGSISATMITLTDAEQIRMMRELAVYTGVCHVRTTDGSSYTADVQVSEDREHDDYGKLASFSLTITRVDAETLDGLTYQQWAEEEE